MTDRHAIVARRVFDGSAMLADCCVVVNEGRIESIARHSPSGLSVVHLPDDYLLAPGYIDLQVNGGGGVMFNDAPTAVGIAAIVAAHRGLGTTSLLPTLISGSAAQIRSALDMEPVDGALGVHLEGPFLNANRRGIHPAESIRPIAEADIAVLERARIGLRLVTLAPESVPAATIARLVRSGAVVFAGHSEAGWDQMITATDAGLRGVTHLFNAMAQIAPREPSVVGAALAIPGLMAGLIMDGLHVHPANARLAFAMLGSSRLFLVSDAMATVGSSNTALRIGETEIHLRGGRLTGPDGTLGGAHLCMAEAVRNAVRLLRISIEDALRMATATPAACIGATDRGRLATGARADCVALDANLNVRRVWVGGQPQGCLA